MLALLLCGLVARADGPVDDWEFMAWESLHDSRLGASLGGGEATARVDFARTLGMLPDVASPLKSEVHYWLALALLQAGDVDAAARELNVVRMGEGFGERERALSTFIEVQRRQVTRLPYRQDFDGASTPAPFVRGWQRGSPDDLGLLDLPDGNRVVVWSTEVQRGRDDNIFIPFRDRGPSVLRFALRAERFPAWVRCMMEDDEGQQWNTKVLQVPTDTWSGVQLTLDDFALVGDPRFGRRPDPRRVRSFLLVDVTGFRSEELELNRIFVDDIEVLP